jgi:hypothetical protein
MKFWAVCLFCVFPIFYLSSCTDQSEKITRKSKIAHSKDRTFSIYHEYSQDNSKINVYTNQINEKYCLIYYRDRTYSVTDDYQYRSKWKENYLFEESKEEMELLPYFNYGITKDQSFTKKGYVTHLKNKDILTINLDSYYKERKVGWTDPVYVSMIFFRCNDIQDVYDPSKNTSILPLEYVIRIKA